MEYYKNQSQTILGQPTPRARIYKSESHKLHHAFPVKEEAVIHHGMPVQLETDGTISPYTGDGLYLGIAVTNNLNPAYNAQRNYPVEVTVMVEGFAIVHGAAKEEITECGYVAPTEDIIAYHFVGYTSSSEDTQFIALAPAGENEIIPILVK